MENNKIERIQKSAGTTAKILGVIRTILIVGLVLALIILGLSLLGSYTIPRTMEDLYQTIEMYE